MKTLNERSFDPATPLRYALFGNAAFSLSTGLTMAFCAESLRWLLALRDITTLRAVGCVLTAYSVILAVNGSRKQPRRWEAWAAAILDFCWVLGSAFLIIDHQFSSAGDWLVGLAAIPVSIFAVLQIFGLRALPRYEVLNGNIPSSAAEFAR
jgi:hypothetical protein